MTHPDQRVTAEDDGSDADLDWRAFLVGGGVFLISGISLVVHILTGAPLAVVLGVLVLGGGLTVAVTMSTRPAARAHWRRLVGVGTVVGLVGTVAYDGSRWLLVQVAGFHTSPFKALPFFGQALVGSMGGTTGRTVAGIGFHVLNGCAFGIAYTVWFGRRHPIWGVAFAMGLEAFMLALYPGWLDVRSVQELTSISLLGHVVYGVTLGGVARFLLGRRPLPGGPRPLPVPDR
ncbi:MAG TPA: DUF6789 family protein [Acidimicrobiales bacterium]|nr:DUF6789 family protein [Acidimicrobiales bacterium]